MFNIPSTYISFCTFSITTKHVYCLTFSWLLAEILPCSIFGILLTLTLPSSFLSQLSFSTEFPTGFPTISVSSHTWPFLVLSRKMSSCTYLPSTSFLKCMKSSIYVFRGLLQYLNYISWLTVVDFFHSFCLIIQTIDLIFTFKVFTSGSYVVSFFSLYSCRGFSSYKDFSCLITNTDMFGNHYTRCPFQCLKYFMHDAWPFRIMSLKKGYGLKLPHQQKIVLGFDPHKTSQGVLIQPSTMFP